MVSLNNDYIIFQSILIILWNCDFNSSNLRINVTQRATNVKLHDDDIEMSKHEAVFLYKATLLWYTGLFEIIVGVLTT